MTTSENLLSSLNERYPDADRLKDVDNLALQSIASRGSCCMYQDKAVDLDLVNTLCAVALASPTKSDLQQRDIIVLETEISMRSRSQSRFTTIPFQRSP